MTDVKSGKVRKSSKLVSGAKSMAGSTLQDVTVGDRVIVTSLDGFEGFVRYVGETKFADGKWIGVELDAPKGKNDGSVKGEKYFDCKPNYGVFLRSSAVMKVAPSQPVSSTAPNPQSTEFPASINISNSLNDEGESMRGDIDKIVTQTIFEPISDLDHMIVEAQATEEEVEEEEEQEARKSEAHEIAAPLELNHGAGCDAGCEELATTKESAPKEFCTSGLSVANVEATGLALDAAHASASVEYLKKAISTVLEGLQQQVTQMTEELKDATAVFKEMTPLAHLTAKLESIEAKVDRMPFWADTSSDKPSTMKTGANVAPTVGPVVSGLTVDMQKQIQTTVALELQRMRVWLDSRLEIVNVGQPLLPVMETAIYGAEKLAYAEESNQESEKQEARAGPPRAQISDESKGLGVRHVFFDFDQTISMFHVFKQVAGWEAGVPPPSAFCERGQIHRIMELNAAGKWAYDKQSGTCMLLAEDSGGGCSWTAAALGGQRRVDRLRVFFSQLKNNGIKLTIITKGNVGAVRCQLAQEKLLEFFEHVYGMVGEFYAANDYDKAHLEESEYEGGLDAQLTGTKAALIDQLMREKSLNESEAVLVEDDKAELESVKGLCRSVFVADRKGMTASDMNSIVEMCNLASVERAGDDDSATKSWDLSFRQ